MTKSDGLPKILGIGFVLAVALYAASFAWIQHKRDHKGPWLVVFCTSPEGDPFLLVSQTHLKIDNQRISFADHPISYPNMVRAIYFDGPRTNVPFGQVVFQDPTFLPGTITFDFWGHRVELMPRTMVINQAEIPWHSRSNIVLSGEGPLQPKKFAEK